MHSVLQGMKQIVSDFANSSATINFKSAKSNVPSPWYAEWENKNFASILDNAFTKKYLSKIVDSYYGNQLDDILKEASEMTKEAYSDTYYIYKGCCNSLQIEVTPKVYITRKIRGINALSVEINGKKLILISRQFIVRLTPKEQAFILGHELGHHQQGNLVCHTINGLFDIICNSSEIFGPIMSDTIEVPLKQWCRQSEFNADRAGFICCKDLEVIINLFMKLGMQVKLSAYQEYKELEASHPYLQTRLAALSKYANSQKAIIP